MSRAKGSAHRGLLGLGLSVLSLAVLALLSAGAAYADTATYVGSDECADCHEDQAEDFNKTVHGKAGFDKLSPHGCETCHGAASKHLDDPNVKANQPTLANWTASELSDTCRQCHDGGKQSHWAGGVHEARGVGCTDCHSVHSSQSASAQLKAPTATETCFQCHQSVRTEVRKTSHHPIREGKMGCGDCHNPHGSDGPKMLNAVSNNDLCYQCHTEKRGPFIWEHAPVREDCMNCHRPHGSNHSKLKVAETPFLCQQCHSNTRHPGTLYDASRLPGGASESNRIFNRGCVNCHANIHGSNHPSGPYLGR